jgi:decaprenylphospho-beta-D-ribofuranose 2-oxidase
MFKKKINSLDKSYFTEILYSSPDKYKEFEKVTFKSETIATMGSCNSYTPASFKKNTLSIELKKFNRIIEFDKKNKLITVESGIQLSEFCNFTLSHNLWIPQIPGYPGLTVGGIVASNAHGKSCGFHGTIYKQIKKIKIFHKTHGWLILSENENKEIFELTVGGFGLTGSIVEVQFSLLDFLGNNFITEVVETKSTKDTLNKINQNNKSEIYSYSWNRSDNFKNFGKGLIFKNKINHNKKKDISKKISLKMNNINNSLFLNIWNNYTIKFSQSVYHFFFKYLKSNSYEEDFQNVIFPFVGKELYFKSFGKKGFIESQIIVPLNNLDSFVDEIEFLYKKYKPSITLYSMKNIKGKKKFLRFEDDGICFTFDFVNNPNNLKFMDVLDKICEKYYLTPSIIKDSRLRLYTIKKCYEEYEKFKQAIYKYDKKRIYKSTITDKLQI